MEDLFPKPIIDSRGFYWKTEPIRRNITGEIKPELLKDWDPQWIATPLDREPTLYYESEAVSPFVLFGDEEKDKEALDD